MSLPLRNLSSQIHNANLEAAPIIVNPTSHNLSKPVEDYPAGLPRFAGLIGSHQAFTTCRRFSVVRARLLLLKQDKVSILEESLNEVDEQETRRMFLGSSRRDQNQERRRLLEELDAALKDLDHFVGRCCKVAVLPTASNDTISSLKNWLDGHGGVAREETRWLDFETDIFTTVSCDDGAISILRPWIERIAVNVYRRFRKRPRTEVSRDEHVFVFSETSLRLVTRAVIALILVVLLPIPIVVLQAITSPGPRVVCTALALVTLLLTISCLTNAKTAEMFIAGATYRDPSISVHEIISTAARLIRLCLVTCMHVRVADTNASLHPNIHTPGL
ncbi:hypothetical protein VTL71DRAFT_2058 [Oculimacula yallundae]|uniref:DUF6594 domain-containing protein n=1 Tax=Oculimacula yallundae TaxID=86028 RepID=A0ABR4C8Y6_9HELO